MNRCDVIGDVHGYAEALERLLSELGYVEHGGVWCHEERTAVFVGDIIYPGPQQRETMELVRKMVDAGSALMTMGNHEYNAIAWATPDPRNKGEFLVAAHDSDGGPCEYMAIEAVLEGLEMPLAEPYLDKKGHVRHRERIRWCDEGAITARQLAELPGDCTTVDPARVVAVPARQG